MRLIPAISAFLSACLSPCTVRGLSITPQKLPCGLHQLVLSFSDELEECVGKVLHQQLQTWTIGT